MEAILYLLFPLLLPARRRLGPVVTLAVIVVPAVAAGLLWPGWSTGARATGCTLEMAPLFTLGMLAAGIVTGSERVRRLPWLGLSALAAAPVLTLIVLHDSVWTISRYYWLDLATGPAIALFLVALATRRPARLIRLQQSSPLVALGGFSYSLYLIHMPIVALISTLLIAPHTGPGLTGFTITVTLALPVCLAASRLFAVHFETPFRDAGSTRRGAFSATNSAYADTGDIPADSRPSPGRSCARPRQLRRVAHRADWPGPGVARPHRGQADGT
ncbi:acyltransferase [Actinoplanes hulinensis]|uniref:Acyltransferase n=1 Tax=Actinoplanes hulinensis TaxID=1144547 RepID=A0ABS7AXM2_9ACTN|nr:acyltransferase [Actinoplanes hulinensis]